MAVPRRSGRSPSTTSSHHHLARRRSSSNLPRRAPVRPAYIMDYIRLLGARCNASFFPAPPPHPSGCKATSQAAEQLSLVTQEAKTRESVD